MTSISILMSNGPEMDLHHVWWKQSNPVDLLLQCLWQARCVTNLHLKHILIIGPESVWRAHIHFSSVTVWTGAEGAPPIGKGVSRVIFGLFRCHSSSSNASILPKMEPMSANESSLNQRYNLFWGAFGFHLGARLILDSSNFNTKQDLQFLPILCSISVDLTVLADCQAPVNSFTLTHKLNPVIIWP